MTFAVRRVNLEEPDDDSILQHLPERELIYFAQYFGSGHGRRGGADRAAGARGGTWPLD